MRLVSSACVNAGQARGRPDDSIARRCVNRQSAAADPAGGDHARLLRWETTGHDRATYRPPRSESFRLMKSESRKITVKKASVTSISVTSFAGIDCGVTSPKPKNVKFSRL